MEANMNIIWNGVHYDNKSDDRVCYVFLPAHHNILWPLLAKE